MVPPTVPPMVPPILIAQTPKSGMTKPAAAFAEVTGPASMVTPSTRRHVHVRLIAPCVHVWDSAVAMPPTVQRRTLSTSATTILATASGIALKQHLPPSRHGLVLRVHFKLQIDLLCL